jgi:hypothetical protein
MRKLVVVATAVLIVLLAVVPALAGGWTERISGGSSYSLNYGEFTVTLSAWQKEDGSYGGEGEYYYPPLNRKFHLDVTRVCFGTYSGKPYAVAMGTVRGQDGTEVPGEGYGAIAVLDGIDEPDRFRVWFDVSEAAAIGFCENGAYGLFPAIVQDGNFHVRSK